MSLTPEFLATCQNQRILIIEPFYYTPHVETGLEIAESLAEGNEVTYVGPDVLRCVTDETFRFSSRLLINLSRKRHVTNYLRGNVRKYRRDEIEALSRGLNAPDPRGFVDLSAPDLHAVKFGDFDVGMGIISSLLSLTRDPAVEPSRYANYAMALARDAMMLHQLTGQLIRATGCDIVVFFNGRLAPVRGIRRACEAANIRYIVHERGSSIGKYALFDCATSHQPAGYRGWVDSWWEATPDPQANALEYLDKRRRGIVTSWYSFTRKQISGQCPPKDGRKRVTFFTSSEDELAAIGDELRPDSRLCDQAHSIRSLGEACQEKGFEYIIRFHPNTPASATGLLAVAREASPTVFEADSGVDTYALIDSSDVVTTQNSTVGIEAASIGKPVFYTGRNIFEYCRSVRRLMNDQDIVVALDVASGSDCLDALKYANFFAIHGIPYRHYEPSGIVSGTYRGLDLNAPLSRLRAAKLRLTRGGI